MRTWLQREGRMCAAAAAIAYLLLCAWWMRDVLPDPGNRVLGAPRAWKPLLNDSDQLMVISTIARHAHLLATRPGAIAQEGNCFPTPSSYTLGEHMFGNALLAAAPLAFTGDPILAYNVLLVLQIWISAMAMYALSFFFTRSAPAAFGAGLTFAFSSSRLGDAVHLYVSAGDLWAPLALLFLHRLFRDGTWRSALGLAVFFSLLILESLYTLVSSSILVGVVGLYLAARDPRRLRTVAPRLAAAGIVIALVTWIVLGPYLGAAATWGGFKRAITNFAPLRLFALGAPFFPGVVVLLLAALGIADRARGARRIRDYDPRLVYLAAGLLVFLCATAGIHVLGVFVPSPLALIRHHIPGLNAVRVLAEVRAGAYLVASFLAGYGVLVLVERLGRRAAIAIVALISIVALAEIGDPAFATFSFGAPVPVEVRTIRPDASDVDLVTRTAEGGVLDLPTRKGFFKLNSEQLLLSGYHQRPTATCYNSFATPIQERIELLSRRVPSPNSLAELAALGFRTLYVHREYLRMGRIAHQPAAIARAAQKPDALLTPLGSSAGIDAYRIAAPTSVHSELGALNRVGREMVASTDEATVSPPRATIAFHFLNLRPETFVHPEPLAPSDLIVTWRARGVPDAITQHTRALLPLAIASNARSELQLELDVPQTPGRYRVIVARAREADTPLARASVRVTQKAPDPRP